MRKLVVLSFMTLDGVMQAPGDNWTYGLDRDRRPVKHLPKLA
jgi:hypothetical protein